MAEITHTIAGGSAKMRLWMEVPTRPGHIASDRLWNRINREAMRAALEWHHRQHMPKHFEQGARSRYGYMPRSLKYMRVKDKVMKSRRDLVYSGETEKQTKAGWKALRISGTAVKGTLTGTLEYVLSFAAKVAAGMKKKFAGIAGAPKAVNRAKRDEVRKQLIERRASQSKVRVTIGQMIRELQAITDEERHNIVAHYAMELNKRIAALPQGRRRAG